MLLFRLLGIVVAVAIIVPPIACDMQPPADATESTFATLQAQIEEYVETNHKLPSTLMDLPRVQAEGRQLIKDGWDNDVGYNHTRDGQVSLSSPGSRKFLGKKEPLIHRFRVEVAGPASQRDPAKEDSHFGVP